MVRKKDFSISHRQSDFSILIGEVSCVVHVNMEDAK